MITKVFKKKGDRKAIWEAYEALVNLNPEDPNKKYKAAGSLGGSVNSQFLRRSNDTYERTR